MQRLTNLYSVDQTGHSNSLKSEWTNSVYFCISLYKILHRIITRDVNKDSGFKAKDRTKDSTLKAKAKTKDLSIFNTKDRTKDFHRWTYQLHFTCRT